MPLVSAKSDCLLFLIGRNPSSRYEVLQLKKTLRTMLEKAGITDDDEELRGPSQVGKKHLLIVNIQCSRSYVSS